MELSRGQSSPEVQQQMQQPEPTQQREAQIQQTREQVDQHSQHPKMAQELDKYTPQQQEAIKQSIAEDAANVGRGNTKIDLLGMKDQNTIVGRVNQAFYFETNIPQALDKAAPSAIQNSDSASKDLKNILSSENQLKPSDFNLSQRTDSYDVADRLGKTGFNGSDLKNGLTHQNSIDNKGNWSFKTPTAKQTQNIESTSGHSEKNAMDKLRETPLGVESKSYLDQYQEGIQTTKNKVDSFLGNVQDSATSKGYESALGAAKYMAAEVGKGASNFIFGGLDTTTEAAKHPTEFLKGVPKGVANFGADTANFGINSAQAALSGWAMMGEKAGIISKETADAVTTNTPYNLTPPTTIDNKAQAAGAVLTQGVIGMGAALKGNAALGGRKLMDEGAASLQAEKIHINNLANEAREANQKLAQERILPPDEEYFTPKHNELGGEFQTKGLEPAQVPRNIREDMYSRYNAKEFAKTGINSGESIPIPTVIDSADSLYKLTKGSASEAYVGPYSQFWMTGKELEWAKQHPNLINERFGLPESSQGPQFQIFEIQPKPGQAPVVYESTIATTTNQSGLVDVGKGQQMLIPDRSLWTEPKNIGEILINK